MYPYIQYILKDLMSKGAAVATILKFHLSWPHSHIHTYTQMIIDQPIERDCWYGYPGTLKNYQ